MKKPTVTTIIPVYNEEKYIGECLDSLLKQTLKPLEIIVVDDGSTDGSVTIVKQLMRYGLRVRNQGKPSTRHPQTGNWITANLILLKQAHQGPAKARNFGAKKAKGEILVFPDADMRFDEKYLERLVKPIVDGKALATFTKEEYVANPENIWSQCWSINSGWPINLHIDPEIPDEANNFRAILKDVFLKTNGYQNVGYGEDVTVLAQLKGVGAKVASGAICYHFNPSTLMEVFLSARWMGRGETIKRDFKSLLTYSFLNSLRRGLLESIKHKKSLFLIFKIVFDSGITVGLIERVIFNVHTK